MSACAPAPPHGTTRRYRLGCHCPDCTNGARKDRGRRVLLKTTGRWRPYTDAAPVRDRILALRAAGLTIDAVARATATPGPTLEHLQRGDYTQVRTETARRVLAVDPATAAAERYLVDATGTRRRLQALYWRGYSTAAIRAAVGLNERSLREITRGAAATVTRETRDAAAAACRRLADTDPAGAGVPRDAVERARAFARRRGFAPAAAWDEDTIDDPAAGPDLGAPVRRRDAIAEDAAWIASTAGGDRDQIAARLGITRNYLDKVDERRKAEAR